MGVGFDRKAMAFDCGGQRVTAALDTVFLHPRSNPFTRAKAAIPYLQVAQASGNWKDLMVAYLIAGVDAGQEFPAWCFYLEQMGNADPQYIIAIATERLRALNSDTGIQTKTHGGATALSLHQATCRATRTRSIHVVLLNRLTRSGKTRRYRMVMRPAVVTDSAPASWCPACDGRLPPSAATDSQLQEAARFVISPDGHADDATEALMLSRANALIDETGKGP